MVFDNSVRVIRLLISFLSKSKFRVSNAKEKKKKEQDAFKEMKYNRLLKVSS